MSDKKIDAIVILGGGLIKDKNGWRTIRFGDMKNSSAAEDVFGDNLRVVAGYFLYKNQQEREKTPLILVSGGRGYLRKVKGAPCVAKVLKKELLKLGIPRSVILEEKKSDNTYQQLKILSALILKNKWKNIAIVSNWYHLPRVRAIIENVKDLEFLKNQIKSKKIFLLSAENIVLKYDKKKWGDTIARAMKSKWMKKRIVLEKQGIRQLKAGLYKLR